MEKLEYKDKIQKLFRELTEELTQTTEEKDSFEVEYELEKARMIMSAEVSSFSNQTMRDAQVTILMEANGMYRKMAELRGKAKIAWYKWSGIKALIDGKVMYEEPKTA